jgi:TonB-dependent receptor
MNRISEQGARRPDLRGLLLIGIALPALMAAPVRAEETDDQQGNDSEIVVVGSRPIAESESAALEIQRKSDSLVSVLAADAIGRLPDQNLGQAISRLPGIAVQRDQGQARFVSLRGAPNKWTTLSFNGIFVVSPEGREARFDSIPSAIASQVVVQKAVTPDLNGETIAGNVNIVTRSAFDYNGVHFQTKFGLGTIDLGGGGEYEGSFVLSNRWETGIGEIGALISGSYYERNMATENFEVDWLEVPRDQRPGFEDRVWPRELENKLYRLQRKNWSLSGRLDWAPDSTNRIFVESVYTIFVDKEARDNYRLRPDEAARLAEVPNSPAACTTADRTPPAGTTGFGNACVNTPFQGTVTGSRWDARFRVTDYSQSVFTNTLGGDHDFGKVRLKWRGNYTQSVNDATQPYVITYTDTGFGSGATAGTTRPAFTYDLTDYNFQTLQLFRTVRDGAGNLTAGAPVASFRDVANQVNQVQSTIEVAKTNAYTGRVELAVDTAFLGDTTFRFGTGYDQRTKENNADRLQVAGGGLRTGFQQRGIGITLDQILSTGQEGPWNIQPGYRADPFLVDQGFRMLDAAKELGSYAPLTANFYNVREQIWSGFVMGTTRVDWGTIVYGVRVENVRNTGRAFSVIPGQGNTAVTSGSNSTLFFPSAHINWNAREDMKVRLSFNSGAARPDYDELRPNFTVNDPDERLSGGNPFARPEKAYGVDLYWEWYVMPRGFVSLGVFYKTLRDVLFDDTRLFNSSILNFGGIDRSRYQLSTLVNGGSGHIYGAEAAFQMQLDPFLKNDSWIGGFGIQANVTYNSSRATTPGGQQVTLPGTSQWVINVGPYYEKYGFSARLAYQRRTNWLDSLGQPEIGGDIYWATDEELDASVRYSVTPNIEVFAEGANLLNGPGRRWVGIRERTLEWERFGRRFMGGFRVTF